VRKQSKSLPKVRETFFCKIANIVISSEKTKIEENLRIIKTDRYANRSAMYLLQIQVVITRCYLFAAATATPTSKYVQVGNHWNK
jgi:hypothetical protein